MNVRDFVVVSRALARRRRLPGPTVTIEGPRYAVYLVIALMGAGIGTIVSWIL